MGAWPWLVLAALLVVAEVVTMALFAIFVAAGAAAAALSVALGATPLLAAGVLVVVSIGGLAAGRRPLLHLVGHGRRPLLRSGVAGLVGQRATVVTVICGVDQAGSVRARGEEWPAISYDEVTYQPGEVVHIVDIERTRLVVTVA